MHAFITTALEIAIGFMKKNKIIRRFRGTQMDYKVLLVKYKDTKIYL